MNAIDAVNELEAAAGVTPSTSATDLASADPLDSKKYYEWLRRQAQHTASGIPLWTDLLHLPA
jgi:hypothetical protein